MDGIREKAMLRRHILNRRAGRLEVVVALVPMFLFCALVMNSIAYNITTLSTLNLQGSTEVLIEFV